MLKRTDLNFLETVLQFLPAMWTKQTKRKEKKHCIQNSKLKNCRQFNSFMHPMNCVVQYCHLLIM